MAAYRGVTVLASNPPVRVFDNYNILTYRVNANNNSVTITENSSVGLGNLGNNNLVIPSTAAGLTVTLIGTYAFGHSTITSAFIPATVLGVGIHGFSGCFNLSSVEFEDTVQNPSQLRRFDIGAFWGTAITTLKFPDTVQRVSNGAFSGNLQLKHVTFGRDFELFGTAAFDDCISLETITFRSPTPPLVSLGAFGGICSSRTIIVYVPQAARAAYEIFLRQRLYFNGNYTIVGI